MSFGSIGNSSLDNKALKSLLENAEKSGKTEISINLKKLMQWPDNNDMNVGQIVAWDIKDRYNSDDSKWKKRPLKNTWKVASKVKSDDSNDTIITLSVHEGPYLPEKQNKITMKDMNNIVDKLSGGLLREGRFGIKSNGDYSRVTKIYVDDVEDKNLTDEMPLINPHKVSIKQDAIFVDYEYESKERYNGKFDGKDRVKVEKYLEEWAIIEDDIVTHEKNMLLAETEGLNMENPKLLGGMLSEDSTALVGFDSKDYLVKASSKLGETKNKALVAQRSFSRTLQLKREELEMILEKKKTDLAMMMKNLDTMVATLNKEMKKIYKLITTLEIYMGVCENIIQISSGDPASLDTPISIRQMQLYMDEEFGDPEYGGLDFEGIEKFDTWLIESKGYLKVIPEEKCVVVMRPRRHDKDRGDIHPILKAQYDLNDKMAYILIRNGNNIYRIWSDNISFIDRLFPKRKEFQEIVDEIVKHNKEYNEQENEYYRKIAMEKIEKTEDKIFYYKRNFLLLQGIITRTDIFKPIPDSLNLLDANTYGDSVNFIYDDEITLPSNRIPYDEWQRGINRAIVKGSRVFVNYTGYGKDWKGRFNVYMNEHNYPRPPKGVFEVKERFLDKKKPNTVDMEKVDWKKYLKMIDELVFENQHLCNKQDRFSTDYPGCELPKDLQLKHVKYYRETGSYSKTPDAEGFGKYNDNNMISIVSLAEWVEGNTSLSNITKQKGHMEESETPYKKSELYNPGGEVYGSWGEWDPHERKANMSFKINIADSCILNYDALILDDIEFYLNDRVNRSGYLHMMPVLWGIKKMLLDEIDQEKFFIGMTASSLSTETGIQIEDVNSVIADCIKWWKNEVVTVWKRPIAKDNKKAWYMITNRAKSILKKKGHKVIVNFDNRKNVLGWKNGKYVYFATGLTKKEFVDTIRKISPVNVSKMDYESKAEINRGIYVVTDEKLIAKASSSLSRELLNETKN